jgi:thiaminase (transcriptional activator TenA)
MGYLMAYQKMLRAIRPLEKSIFQHPFNLGLADGTLSRQRFERFLHQDKYYLYEFSRVLKKIGQRFSDNEHQALFKNLSQGAFKTQDHLHLKYLAPIKTPHFFQPKPVSILPAVQAYVDYLHEVAEFSPIEQAVPSCIPCFYIYGELGRRMQLNGMAEDNHFHLWVASYSSKNFLNSGRLIAELANHLAKQPGVDEQMMIHAFVQSTQHEISMWDAVCTDEQASNDSAYADQMRLIK